MNSSSRSVLTKRRPAKSSLKGLSHCQIASVSEWSLYELLLNSKILEAIVELGIGHVDAQLLKDICVLWIKEEPHLAEPVKRTWTRHLVLDENTSDVSLMNQFCYL